MIDCNKTEVFLRTKRKMCISFNDCADCPLGTEEISCVSVLATMPEKAIEIVQEYANKNFMTYKDKVKIYFPQIKDEVFEFIRVDSFFGDKTKGKSWEDKYIESEDKEK